MSSTASNSWTRMTVPSSTKRNSKILSLGLVWRALPQSKSSRSLKSLISMAMASYRTMSSKRSSPTWQATEGSPTQTTGRSTSWSSLGGTKDETEGQLWRSSMASTTKQLKGTSLSGTHSSLSSKGILQSQGTIRRGSRPFLTWSTKEEELI